MEKESETHSHEESMSASSPRLHVWPSHRCTEGPWLISRPQLGRQQTFSDGTKSLWRSKGAPSKMLPPQVERAPSLFPPLPTLIAREQEPDKSCAITARHGGTKGLLWEMLGPKRCCFWRVPPHPTSYQ